MHTIHILNLIVIILSTFMAIIFYHKDKFIFYLNVFSVFLNFIVVMYLS